jgi:FAD-linked sulfhydryl oxidase
VCKDGKLSSSLKTAAPGPQAECPLEKKELGKYSWSLLHTFAAYYPLQPTEEDQRAMQGFLEGFKLLFPCKYCRGHFKKDYERGTHVPT